MGNTNSMNNISLLDQKNGLKYSTEFLRYSQIPYESSHHQMHHGNMNNLPHHFKYKDRDPSQLPNQIKVLPDVKFEQKLRPTNNGALIQNGGTISGRRDSDCGLHRSKSITENNNCLPPNAMPPFVMQRARTQLQINLNPPPRGNLNRNFGSNMDLRMQEIKSLERPKPREIPKKKAPAPAPPMATKTKAQPAPKPAPQKLPERNQKQQPVKKTDQKPDNKPKIVGTRLFGDTLKKSQNNDMMNPRNKVLPTPSNSKLPVNRQRSSEFGQNYKNPIPERNSNRLPPATRINPTSYLRRERTFDMTLIHSQPLEKPKQKYSPQLPKKKPLELPHVPVKRQPSTSTIDRKVPPALRSSTSSLFQDELKAVAKRRSLTASSNDNKMKTIDKPLKKSTLSVELRKSTSAINSSTLSLAQSQKSNSIKDLSRPSPSPALPEAKTPVGDNIIEEKEEPIVRQEAPKNNFYFGMNDKSANDTEDEQMDAINKFAEDIFKMTGGGKFMTQNQVSSESALSSDCEDAPDSFDICLNLRPTLPRKQLQIPRFSPVAAWRSLLTEANSSETKIDQTLSNSTMQLHMTEDTRNEVKIERIYREPSFNMLNQQHDNKSGDSGISAGDAGNTPEGNIPPAYLMTSWTPQQDLEDEEESVAGVEKQQEEIKPVDAENAQTFFSNSGHIFSLSLPRESHSSSEKTPQNNFYSLQKFKNKVADVFGGVSISTINDKIQISNYGVDGNWLLSSQPSSINEFGKVDVDKNQIISHLASGKHVMYLPSKFDEKDVIFESKIEVSGEEQHNITRESLQDPIPVFKASEEEVFTPKVKKNHRFTFQSTVRQVERRKIAEKLSREAEEKEQQRLSELEAMQKVEEEFQKKRAREKASIRHQLKIFSMEENFGNPSTNYKAGNFGNLDNNSDDDSVKFVDTKTPYISRIIEMKSSKSANRVSDC